MPKLQLIITLFRIYNTVHNGSRHLIRCETCNRLFAETINTAMENLKTPISKVASALLLRSEGLSLWATGRVLESHKGTIARWEQLFADQKETLMLYSFCHEFVSLTFEGEMSYIPWRESAPDVHHIIHNYVRPHWITGKVPTVSLGIMSDALSLESILTMQRAA